MYQITLDLSEALTLSFGISKLRQAWREWKGYFPGDEVDVEEWKLWKKVLFEKSLSEINTVLRLDEAQFGICVLAVELVPLFSTQEGMDTLNPNEQVCFQGLSLDLVPSLVERLTAARKAAMKHRDDADRFYAPFYMWDRLRDWVRVLAVFWVRSQHLMVTGKKAATELMGPRPRPLPERFLAKEWMLPHGDI